MRIVPPAPGQAIARQRQHDVVGLSGHVELRRQHAAERAVHGREQVEEREQPEHAHGRAARGVAVGVGVEAHEHVRQAHRAEEGRDQQRVDEQRRAAAGAADRARPGVAPQRRRAGGDRHDPVRRDPHIACAPAASPSRPALTSTRWPCSDEAAGLRELHALALAQLDGEARCSRRAAASRPNSAARSGRPPKWISSTIAGTAIANTLIQNWKAWT